MTKSSDPTSNQRSGGDLLDLPTAAELAASPSPFDSVFAPGPHAGGAVGVAGALEDFGRRR